MSQLSLFEISSTFSANLNGTERFKKCKQLLQYIYSYLETSGVQSSNLYLNVVHFYNTSVN
jgi:hypothetical protein